MTARLHTDAHNAITVFRNSFGFKCLPTTLCTPDTHKVPARLEHNHNLANKRLVDCVKMLQSLPKGSVRSLVIVELGLNPARSLKLPLVWYLGVHSQKPSFPECRTLISPMYVVSAKKAYFEPPSSGPPTSLWIIQATLAVGSSHLLSLRIDWLEDCCTQSHWQIGSLSIWISPALNIVVSSNMIYRAYYDTSIVLSRI